MFDVTSTTISPKLSSNFFAKLQYVSSIIILVIIPSQLQPFFQRKQICIYHYFIINRCIVQYKKELLISMFNIEKKIKFQYGKTAEIKKAENEIFKHQPNQPWIYGLKYACQCVTYICVFASKKIFLGGFTTKPWLKQPTWIICLANDGYVSWSVFVVVVVVAAAVCQSVMCMRARKNRHFFESFLARTRIPFSSFFLFPLLRQLFKLHVDFKCSALFLHSICP